MIMIINYYNYFNMVKVIIIDVQCNMCGTEQVHFSLKIF